MKLLVVGATGLVGATLVQQALTDPRVERVVALTRRPLVAGGKLENVVVPDFAALPERADWWAVDGVACTLGTTRAETPSPAAYRMIDHDWPLAVARSALAAGATRFALVSSVGADLRARSAYLRLKGELETALARIGYPSLTVVRPSMLAGPRERERAGERTLVALFRALGPVLPRRFRLSPAAAVARAMLNGAVAGPPGLRIVTNSEMADPTATKLLPTAS